MSSSRRVELDALYVLHHRPWRDSSRMLEVITRNHGRLTLFARGVRGPRAAMARREATLLDDGLLNGDLRDRLRAYRCYIGTLRNRSVGTR